MLGFRKVTNYPEVKAAVARVQRRLGSLVEVKQVRPGSLFRFEPWDEVPGRHEPLWVLAEERSLGGKLEGYRIESLWSHVFGTAGSDILPATPGDAHGVQAVTAPVGRLPELWNLVQAREVRLVAKSTEWVRPEYEPELTTHVRFNPDGTVCCQNFVHHHQGQHFRLTRADYDRLRRRDRLARKWERMENPAQCPCALAVGQVREFDGRVWGNIDVSLSVA